MKAMNLMRTCHQDHTVNDRRDSDQEAQCLDPSPVQSLLNMPF